MKLLTVCLEAINLKEKKFCLSPFIDYQKLVPSIARVGLLVPPLVKSIDNGLMVISGWRRVLACYDLKIETIPILLTSAEATDLDLLVQVIEENVTTRSLSLAEKAEAISKLQQFGLSEAKIMADFFPRFSLPQKREYFQLLTQVATQGSEELKRFLHQQEISMEALAIFLTFPPEAQKKLIPFLQTLSYSQRREIVFYFQEIASRDGCSVEDLLKNKEILAFFDHSEVSSRSKSEALIEWLRQKRYPLITSWKKEIDQTLRELSWPQEVHLAYDPTFERPEIKVCFSFCNQAQFLFLLDKLKKIGERPAFRRLFRRTFEE
ncbi:MAG: ParB N-terminal domain-containing protein [Candidatus Aminicenantes bacterium]|nr:ParB N-terminal domain-containing protein [Candidatus Aminicenantes bacterium]